MCGSPQATAYITINVRTSPLQNFISDKVAGCPPFAVEFTDQNQETFDEYFWDFGDNTYSNDRYATHYYEHSGLYTVSLQIRDDLGCTYVKTATNMIRVYEKPSAIFTMTPDQITQQHNEVVFNNLSQGAISYQWDFGDGQNSLMTNPNHFFAPDTTVYKVCLVATNINDCSDTSCRNINVNGLFYFYMPTSFTPNNDSHNDCFRPCVSGISTEGFSLKIFDRYGSIVYQTDMLTSLDYNEDCDVCSDDAWNGKYRNTGKMLENGVYIWKCDFQDAYGNSYSRQGTITLLR
jgi:gliding motility-associated-like protein